MINRFKVTVYSNDEGNIEDYPKKISFVNLMRDTPARAMELKHSNSGYQWIAGGDEVTHLTGFLHLFEVSDQQNTPIAAVYLSSDTGLPVPEDRMHRVMGPDGNYVPL